jgi:hypothetical protein
MLWIASRFVELIVHTEFAIKGDETSRSSAVALFTVGFVQETKK